MLGFAVLVLYGVVRGLLGVHLSQLLAVVVLEVGNLRLTNDTPRDANVRIALVLVVVCVFHVEDLGAVLVHTILSACGNRGFSALVAQPCALNCCGFPLFAVLGFPGKVGLLVGR